MNALTLGKAAYRTLTVNVVIAVLFNVIGMVLAAFGLIMPLLAVGWTDPNCGCEIEVTKGAQAGAGGNLNPRCCCGKEMQKA